MPYGLVDKARTALRTAPAPHQQTWKAEGPCRCPAPETVGSVRAGSGSDVGTARRLKGPYYWHCGHHTVPRPARRDRRRELPQRGQAGAGSSR
ncbi:hypothetical protein GCM10010307_27750 [Streptomyces vastus]|uniref:Zinc finger CGNR domain-containing protein n=1 Tax=Streptomyces vastus TaxID=285451 RepID=A0ABP6D6F8_9ACTN